MSNYHAFSRSRVLYLHWAPALIAFFLLSLHTYLFYFYAIRMLFLLHVDEPESPCSIGWVLKEAIEQKQKNGLNWSVEFFWKRWKEMKGFYITVSMLHTSTDVYAGIWGYANEKSDRMRMSLTHTYINVVSKYAYIHSRSVQILIRWSWFGQWNKWPMYHLLGLLLRWWATAELCNMKCL